MPAALPAMLPATLTKKKKRNCQQRAMLSAMLPGTLPAVLHLPAVAAAPAKAAQRSAGSMQHSGGPQRETLDHASAEEGNHISGPVVPRKPFCEIMPVMATMARRPLLISASRARLLLTGSLLLPGLPATKNQGTPR